MDALGGLLDHPRARRAFLLRAEMDPPWAIRVEDRAPLTVVVVARGAAVLLDDAGTAPASPSPTVLGVNDVALLRGPTPYTMADHARTPPRIRILPGQGCYDPDGQLLAEDMSRGVRTWGNARHGATSLLIGTYQGETEVGRRVLSALPRAVVLRADQWHSPLVPVLAQEMARDEPGQSAVLDRLLDLVLVAAMRAWLARERAPGWYAAQSDPAVGRALRLIHHDPAHPWSVASLAQAAGLSRAAFARRFTQLVGEAPMTYLTRWRLDLAADLLAEPDLTLDAIARRVGYSTGFALSTAFKRERGIPPVHHRRALTAPHSAVAPAPAQAP